MKSLEKRFLCENKVVCIYHSVIFRFRSDESVTRFWWRLRWFPGPTKCAYHSFPKSRKPMANLYNTVKKYEQILENHWFENYKLWLKRIEIVSAFITHIVQVGFTGFHRPLASECQHLRLQFIRKRFCLQQRL